MIQDGYLHWSGFCDDELIALARSVALHYKEKFVPTTVSTGDQSYRQSKVLWHYDYQNLYDHFTTRLRTFIPDLRRAFPGVPDDPDIELQLTTHNTGDFFKRHIDNGSDDTKTRVLTYVWYFTMDEEQKFSGGQLILETNNTWTIEPRHNTIIFFPSGCWHEVLPITVPSNEWIDSRMTLNGWIRIKLENSPGAET